MTSIELKETIASFQRSGKEFCYMMLSRMEQDCLYYLGYGNRCKKHLWAGDERDHIELMKMLYNILPEKPEWITKEKIEEYSKKMIGDKKTKIKTNLYLKEFVLDYGSGILLSEKVAISPHGDEAYLTEVLEDYRRNEPIPSDVVIISKAQFETVFKPLFEEIHELNKED